PISQVFVPVINTSNEKLLSQEESFNTFQNSGPTSYIYTKYFLEHLSDLNERK
ncbi:7697_t:CDS:1, partial [Entrophospora sp. SA101]